MPIDGGACLIAPLETTVARSVGTGVNIGTTVGANFGTFRVPYSRAAIC